MGRLQFTLFGNTIDIQAVPKGDEAIDDPTPVDESSQAQAREREILPAGGPGCFDSTFDLLRGLDVREGSPGDPNLLEWLEDFMRKEASTIFDAEPIEASSGEAPGSPVDDFSAYGIDGLELL